MQQVVLPPPLFIPVTRVHVNHVLSRLLEKVNNQSNILIYIKALINLIHSYYCLN